MTNGAEVVCCMAGFYYFSKLNYVKGTLKLDRNMLLMVVAISLAFLIRSSSLVGWIPLALAAIFKNNVCGNLWIIIQAGLLVTLPMLILSFCLDSLYYGKWTWT